MDKLILNAATIIILQLIICRFPQCICIFTVVGPLVGFYYINGYCRGDYFVLKLEWSHSFRIGLKRFKNFLLFQRLL